MGWERRIVLLTSFALLSVVAAAWAVLWYFIPAPPSTITMAAGFKGGAFGHTAERY